MNRTRTSEVCFQNKSRWSKKTVGVEQKTLFNFNGMRLKDVVLISSFTPTQHSPILESQNPWFLNSIEIARKVGFQALKSGKIRSGCFVHSLCNQSRGIILALSLSLISGSSSAVTFFDEAQIGGRR